MSKLELDLFGVESDFPPKANIPLFREKLASFRQTTIQSEVLPPQLFENLVDLFGNVLDYIDVLEQDVFDLKVVLSTTVQHCSVIEDELNTHSAILRNKSRKFEFIVNSSGDWMGLINRRYEYEEVNDSMAGIFSKSVDQVVGRSLEKIWGAEFFATHIRGSVDSCFDGHEIQEHVQCNFPRGRDRWCEFTYTPFRNSNNEITHVACIGRDISARRRAESLLSDHTIYLDKVNDAIIVIGLDQKIYYCNRSAERIYGWKRELVVDKKKIDMLGIRPDKIEQVLGTVKEKGEWRGEMSHYSKTRKEVSVDSSWTLIRTQENEEFVVVTNTDITEKKLLEQQFLRVQRMEGIGSVASGIAHDLNNVLSALFMSIRLLKPKCTDDSSVRILELLDNSATRGVSLVRQILEFAKGIDGNELVIPMNKILSEIQDFVKSTFPATINIRCEIAPDLWQIVGNPTQIHQVVLNLCVNAKDAMPSGGDLELICENMVVKDSRRLVGLPRLITPGNYVCLAVKDSGAGIAKSVLAKIFDPFFTTKEKGKGTGLGLSTAQTIVKNHGGYLSVRSRLNQGTEFKIYLPVSQINSAEADSSGQLNLKLGWGVGR